MELRKAALAVALSLALAPVIGVLRTEGGEDAMVKSFVLYVDGGQKTIQTKASTFGEALSEAGITVAEDDKTFPSLKSPVNSGMKTRIIRVQKKTLTFKEPVARQTVRRMTANLRPGHSKVADSGKDGLKEVTYQVTYADGKKALKEQIASKVLQEAKPRVIVYGKGSAMPSRGFFSRKVLVMEATAYDPGPRSCGPSADGYTSTGMKAGKGVVAVDPKVIPLGTRMYIEGYGFAVAGDVGSAIKGNKIDLGHDTYHSAVKFGRRKVVVHLID